MPCPTLKFPVFRSFVWAGILAGCATPPAYYADPVGVRTATISVGGAAIFTSVLVQDEDRCIAHRPLGNRYHVRDARQTVLVPAGKPVLMSYNYRMGRSLCDITYVFLPEADRKYTITAGFEFRTNPDASTFVRALGADKYETCAVHVTHETDAGGVTDMVYPLKPAPQPRSAGKSGTCLKVPEPWATLVQ